ncbi:MAG: endolytic transglycosylase MltG [Microbacteriaceae bacterium]
MNRRIRRILLVALAALLALAGFAFVAKDSVRWAIDVATGSEFVGAGHGSVTIVIQPGDTGLEVAQELSDAGVTASQGATYREILRRNVEFYPGAYELALGMGSGEAITAIVGGSARVETKVLIKEGWRSGQIFKALSQTYDVPLKDFEAVKPADLGLPRAALNLDGYLFPATYVFTPKQSAKSMLSAMHQRMQQELDDLGVKAEETHRILTMAALVQREGRNAADFSKMARVFQNRIDTGMHLQSDATVSYGVNSKTVATTAAQRANDNPWNTYLHAGLPAGPISAPGSAAIKAAMNPAKGDWLFFCTVNLETGETEFNATYAEHLVSVAKWQAWMAAHPDWK